MSTRYTPEVITTLAPDEIFVFGANEAGRHGAGAARDALEKFGAQLGRGDGRQGQSYGISTKDVSLNVIPLWRISIKIDRFLRYARNHPECTFLVTKIGCGLAGYSTSDIGPLFFGHPTNVILPREFHEHAR